MGPKKPKFAKPIYEISIESQNKVYINEEDKGPLRRFAAGLSKFVLWPIAALITATLVFQLLQNAFFPPQLLVSVHHISSGESLSPADLDKINIYIDDSSTPISKKVGPEGITIKWRKKGEHILGVENPASRVDSALFHKEKSFIKNIHLSHALRRGDLRGDKIFFSHHKVISKNELVKAKVLFYTVTAAKSSRPHLFFSGVNKSPQLVLFSPSAQLNNRTEPIVKNFSGRTLEELSKFSKNVRCIGETEIEEYESSFDFRSPRLKSFSWYAESLNSERYAFAQKTVRRLGSTIFMAPKIYTNNGNTQTDIVLAFAPLGGVDFQAIQIRACNADPTDEKFLFINDDVSLHDVIAKYLLIYEEFVISGIVRDNLVQQFAEFCSSLSPQVDALVYFDNQVIRSANGKPEKPVELDLENFLSEIEPLTCMPLYERLMSFWTRDAATITESSMTLRNREILRAILRRSLALKAEKHMCSEKNWPSVSQQLLLFQAMQNHIAQEWTWEWLSSEPWLDMVKSEIDSLSTNE